MTICARQGSGLFQSEILALCTMPANGAHQISNALCVYVHAYALCVYVHQISFQPPAIPLPTPSAPPLFLSPHWATMSLREKSSMNSLAMIMEERSGSKRETSDAKCGGVGVWGLGQRHSNQSSSSGQASSLSARSACVFVCVCACGSNHTHTYTHVRLESHSEALNR